MNITTEVYRNIKGKMVRRHLVNLGGHDYDHSLTTKELYTLVVLALVELGKTLTDEPGSSVDEL